MTTLTDDRSPNSESNPEPAPTPIAERVAANRWRNSTRIRERLMRVAGLRQRGLSQAAIAGRLGVSEATVSRDTRRLHLLWRQEYTHVANEQRLRLLAGLREAERHCWRVMDTFQDDPERISQLSAVRSNLTAIQREIRMLLDHARAPLAEDYWGYSAVGDPPSYRVALEERDKPADKRVLGLIPYEGDWIDEDNPEQVQRRKAAGDALTLAIAIEDEAGPELTDGLLDSLTNDLAGLKPEQGGDGGGASRNGASVDFEDDE